MRKMEEKVYELDLHGKGLKALPAELKKLKSLRILDASCNKITRLQAGLSENKELRELKLYSNHISGLEGLEKLKELSTLLLQYNEVSTIGQGLKQCCKLHVLRLDHNLLCCLKADEVAACSGSLTHLDLSFNQLSSVEGLGTMTSLTELNLESNDLKEVPSLAHCKKLIELNLSGNPLLTYQLSNLKTLPLKTLKLGSISLSSLSLLPRLPHLQDLHLPHNTISSVEACSSLFPSLELLDLHNNQLDTVPVLAPLASLEGLTELLIEDNPLCSSTDNYRADVTQLLSKLEVLDGISFRANTVAMNTVTVMRPLTPAAAGPSVRQVERQLMEVESQLLDSCSEIAARFRELLQDQPEASGTEGSTSHVQEHVGPTANVSESTSAHSQRTSADCPRSGAADVPIPPLNHSPKRPSTRTRLQEALTYASQSMQTT